jgi:hypothetical protein
LRPGKSNSSFQLEGIRKQDKVTQASSLKAFASKMLAALVWPFRLK